MPNTGPDWNADAAGLAPEGLSESELEAEMAIELPDREAMSIVGLPGAPVVPAADVAADGMDLLPADPTDPADVPDAGA